MAEADKSEAMRFPKTENVSDRRSNETTSRFGVPRPLVGAPVIVAALTQDDDLSRL